MIFLVIMLVLGTILSINAGKIATLHNLYSKGNYAEECATIVKYKEVIHNTFHYFATCYEYVSPDGTVYTGIHELRKKIVEHIAKFISGLWQIHAFGEGNARTTTVFSLILENPNTTASSNAERLVIGIATAKRRIKTLKDNGIIELIGSDKTGSWQVLNNKKILTTNKCVNAIKLVKQQLTNKIIKRASYTQRGACLIIVIERNIEMS